MTGTFTNNGGGAYTFDVSDSTAPITTSDTLVPVEKYLIKESSYKTVPGYTEYISPGRYVNHVWQDPIVIKHPARKVLIPATYGTRGGYHELKISTATTSTGTYGQPQWTEQTKLFTVPEPNIKSLKVIGSSKSDRFDLSRLACSISINGGAGDDVLMGGTGSDTLTGGSGNDTLSGGSGNDTACFSGASSAYKISVSADGSLVISNAAEGTDKLEGIETLQFSDKTISVSSLTNNLVITGTSAGETLTGTAADESLYGYGGNDVLNGGAGADALYGGDGDDTLTGGAGNDTLSGDAGSDTACFSGTYASYTVTLNTDGSLIVSGGSDGTDRLTGIENLKFSDKTVSVSSLSTTHLITGSSANDTLNGTSGDETLYGYAGTDVLYGGAGSDTLYGGDGDDTLWGQDGNDVLDGGTGNDSLTGGNGDDVLYISATSHDRIDGGAGNDTVVLPWSSKNSTFQWGISNGTLFTNFRASNDTDTNYSSVSNAEVLQFTDRTMGLVLGGNGVATLTGTLGANIMIASTDTVAMIGGSGSDSIMGIWSRDDNIRGMDGDDYICGFDGNDTLEGGGGNDQIDGGVGTDTAVFSGARGSYTLTKWSNGDIAVSGADGNDTLSNIENLQFSDQTVAAADIGNTISGTASGETLNGGAGNDSIYGYAGNDSLNGAAGNDELYGGDGNDTLCGGTGDDSLDGGAGIDTVSYSDATSSVVVFVNSSGTVGGGLGADSLANIENLTGSNYADFLFGDEGNNVINGGLGDDWLTGNGGDDTIIGGGGTDFACYFGASSGVNVDLTISTAQDVGGGEGKDRLVDIHNLSGSSYGDTLTGDSETNVFFAGEGNDTVRGLGGTDWLNGQDGDDMLSGGDGDDLLSGGDGNDTLDGGAGTDVAMFAGSATDYMVVANADGSYTVTGAGETDTLTNIEAVSFDASKQVMTLADFQAQAFSPLQALEYIASYKDLMGAFGDDAKWGAKHYFNNGKAEGRKITFSALNYIASYGDLIVAFHDDQFAATEHYLKNGSYEGRKVTFDPLAYVCSYGDLLMAFHDDKEAAAEHYIRNGYWENRKVTFDPLAYVCSYSDLLVAFHNDKTAAEEHYIRNGYWEGRKVTFNALAYIASYTDLIGAFGTDAVAAEEHYIRNGFWEGRKVTFDPVAYLINNTDLGTCGFTASDAAMHYLKNGYWEHRTTNGAFGSEQTNHDLTVGGSVTDTIGTSGDKDWFAVNVTAGQTYTFTLSGADSGNGTLADPFLSICDARGLQLTYANDSTNHDAVIRFTALSTGTCYLVASANDTGTGTYKLFATAGG
ncbi:hypothetical protein [Rhizomicrobium electricum]|uniref:Peptidase C-terminal archaeal/bacterial domain-containing protein n=1 Tax=Rhizomicrobium electricum TaxID=480070 RepID=A0ABP3PFG2_9PROT|nr:hypothetical protein [Rhizomicrobium electricum]NIJ48236.1 Ca2+-binding RTX toxin-like protein [Rhizomicrobium electricum]